MLRISTIHKDIRPIGAYIQAKITIRSASESTKSSICWYRRKRNEPANRIINNDSMKINSHPRGSCRLANSYPGVINFRIKAQIVQIVMTKLPWATKCALKNFPGRIKFISRINPNSSRHSIRATANTYEARKKMSVVEWEFNQLGIWNSIRKVVKEKTINNIREKTGRDSWLFGNFEGNFIRPVFLLIGPRHFSDIT